MSDKEYSDCKEWLEQVDFEVGKAWIRGKSRDFWISYNCDFGKPRHGDGRLKITRLGFKQCRDVSIPMRMSKKRRRAG